MIEDSNHGLCKRWWIYQQERFPIFSYSLLVFAFSSAAVIYPTFFLSIQPELCSLIITFITLFCAFLQLRIADEFKDYEQDCQYRPDRPVPRGLIQLRELRILEIITIAIQLAATLMLSWQLFPYLGILWIFQALMRKEFFIRDWLRSRPLLYLLSHNLVLPLMALYGMMTIWIQIAPWPDRPMMASFLILSSLQGFLIEIGRKIRAPEQEATGVETYSQAWGLGWSLFAWFQVGVGSAALTLMLLKSLYLLPMLGIIPLLAMLGFYWLAHRFFQNPSPRGSKQINNFSALWVLVSYLNVGVIPWLVQPWLLQR